MIFPLQYESLGIYVLRILTSVETFGESVQSSGYKNRILLAVLKYK